MNNAETWEEIKRSNEIREGMREKASKLPTRVYDFATETAYNVIFRCCRYIYCVNINSDRKETKRAPKSYDRKINALKNPTPIFSMPAGIDDGKGRPVYERDVILTPSGERFIVDLYQLHIWHSHCELEAAIDNIAYGKIIEHFYGAETIVRANMNKDAQPLPQRQGVLSKYSI